MLALFGGTPVRTRPFTAWPIFGKAEEKRLLRALRSGKWGRLDGPEVAEFEKRFAAMHGCKHGIAVVNGTVSLRIALLAAGIRAEDEVIVPPYTFVSTASAVVEANAIPVFADIDLHTFNLDPAAVEAAITPRTRAIIPVHFAGQPADMDAIMAIAAEHELLVIEDAAHAHGASYEDRPAGSLGHMASFSFQSSKNLTAGEGGIITTNDDALAEACRSIHNCGRVPDGVWYEHHVISGNYRLGEFQGAVLNCQLDRLEEQTKTRDRNGQYLASRLARLPGLHPQTASCRLHAAQLSPVHAAARRRRVRRAARRGAQGAAGRRHPVLRRLRLLAARPAAVPQQGVRPVSCRRPPPRLDYRTTRCPNSDLICREQGLWLGQKLLLGPRDDMDDIARRSRRSTSIATR